MEFQLGKNLGLSRTLERELSQGLLVTTTTILLKAIQKQIWVVVVVKNFLGNSTKREKASQIPDSLRMIDRERHSVDNLRMTENES